MRRARLGAAVQQRQRAYAQQQPAPDHAGTRGHDRKSTTSPTPCRDRTRWQTRPAPGNANHDPAEAARSGPTWLVAREVLDKHERAQAEQRDRGKPLRVLPPPLADAGAEREAELYRDERLHGNGYHHLYRR